VTPILIAAAAVLLVALAWWAWTRTRRSGPREDTVGRPGRIGTHIGALFGRSFDSGFWDAAEEQLIEADSGVPTARRIVAEARMSGAGSIEEAREAIRAALVGSFRSADRDLQLSGSPAIAVVVGVNGSGKTTTIAKLAASVPGRIVVAAADTYRAAAAEQVAAWGDRLGFDVVGASEGADPASVAFDALQAARARGAALLLVDTAGRLHSNRNLMDELAKVVRILEREAGAIDEVLLVVDGSSGQNAVAQAAAFTAAVGVTGVVVTKLDGSARGGAVLAIEHELGVPIKLVGVGEGPDDMLHFEPEDFVDDLLSDS
jgi:fused signal recognition particle receptor